MCYPEYNRYPKMMGGWPNTIPTSYRFGPNRYREEMGES